MRKTSIAFLTIILLLFISINAAAAANIQNGNNSTNFTLNNNSKNITAQYDVVKQANSSVNLINTKGNISISGSVIKCSDGKPFSGVTVTAYTLNGNKISSVLTDKNGKYILSFLSSETVFNVTASYPGHVPSSKMVTVTGNSGPNFYGTASFQLGPEPQVTINVGATQFLNETFNFTVNFKNNGDVPGFGPIVQLILPSEIKLNSASFLGARITVINVGLFPGNSTGTLVDPLSGLTVTGKSGYRLYILEYPLGSFTSGQPTAVIDVNALLLGNSTLGVPLNITAYPVFRFGANETGTTPIRGNMASAQVTPAVIKLSKTSDAPENETATGRNYPHVYTLTVDVANGQTVSTVDVKDIIPGNLQYIKILNAAGGTIIQEPSTSSPGGLLWIQFTNITGVLGPDRIITYQLFAPEFDSSGKNILNNVTGAFTNATNNASVTGTYNSDNVSSSASYTLTLKSLAVQKGVTDTSSPPKPKPADILYYVLNFQVSDYFSIRNMVVKDTLGDGQTFLTGSSYNPYMDLHLPTGSTARLYFNLSDPSQFQMIHDSTTGITYLTFNITQLLIDNGYTGILEGGNYTGTDHGATQGSLCYWSQIDVNYENPHRPIVSADHVDNNVQADADLVESGSTVSDTSGTRVTIVAPTSQKSIYSIERNGVYLDPSTTSVQPGDHVTFSLLVYVPTTNLNDFYIVDYLPIPLFRSGQITMYTSGNIPPPGYWCLADDDTLSNLSGIDPTLLVNTAQNSLTFVYGNIYNSAQLPSYAHILFTVTATGDPMADGLFLTNLMNVNYNNSFSQTYSDNKIVSLVVQEPALNITKTVTPSTGRQAGDSVNYTITITNTGNAPAYNVVVKDNLLANHGYITSTTISARYANGTVIDLTGLGDLFGEGLNFGSLYPIFGINSTNNTIIITYTAILNSTVYPLQVINNTAQITRFTSLPLDNSTNFVTDPSRYQASATVNVLGPQFQKTYLGSQGGPSTGSNLTIGETGKFRLVITLPAGQIHDLVIRDTIPAGMTLVNYTLINNPLINLPGLSFSQIGNIITFLFTGTTNTTYGTNTTFYIDLLMRVDNNSTANPVHGTTSKTNNASMDWNDPGHSAILGSATVNIIEPWLQVTKIFTPDTGAGGQKVTVTLQVKNTGNSTAYNVVITDPLSGSAGIFDLSSVQSYDQNGFIYSFISNTVTFTGGNITPGQVLNFLFNVTVLDDVVVGPTFNNTAYANYYSLLNGTNPDANGRNYTDSGWATFRAGDPSISKVVVNSSIHGNSGKLAVGEHVTYRITVTAPKGQATNLNIRDILPSGYSYVGYTINSSMWNGSLGNLVVTPNGQNILFNFTGATLSLADGNIFYIDLEAVVLNQSANQVGNVKTNNVNLTWDENTHGPFTSAVNTTIVGPALSITKTVTPNPVDGGDKINVSLRVRNTGTSPAYEINLKDVLNSILFNPSTFTYTPVPGYTISINGYTVNIVGDSGTFLDYLSTNNTLYFNFTVNAVNDVPSNSTFTNQATGIYYSLPSTFSERRGTSVSSNVVNINTVNPSITKSVDSTYLNLGGNKVTVGDVVTYRLDLKVPEGKTLNISLKDILPPNLRYNEGTAMIKRSTGDITASGFIFSAVGTYEYINPDSILSFNLGDVILSGTDGRHNATISLIFNVTVLNITGNTNGTLIGNNATLNFTNATGTARSITSAGPNLTVVEPGLQIVKTVNPSVVDGGDHVTINLNATNNGSSPAYQIKITDILDSTLFDPSTFTFTPVAGYTFTRSGNIITITADPGTVLNNGLSQLFTFFVNVRNDAPSNSTFQNTATGSYSSMPAGFDEARNYTCSSNRVNITTVSPSVVKAVDSTSEPASTGTNVFVGEVVTYRLDLTVPEGKTISVSLKDILPANLQYNSGTVWIKRSSDSITATGFTFTLPAGQYEAYTGSILPLLTFNLGDITYNGTNGLNNGTITIIFNTTVLNIITNQNGTKITNNVTLNYTNASGSQCLQTAQAPDLKVTLPQLSTSITSDKTSIQGGDTITYTIVVRNNAGATAPAYGIVVTNALPAGLIYNGVITLPPGWTVDSTDPSNIVFTSPAGFNITPGQNVTIVFQANVTQDMPYNKTVSDRVNATGTTLPGLHGTNDATPGDPGTPTGKRTGQDGSGGLNNIIAVSNVNATSRAPSVSKNSGGQKTVNRSIGNIAPETITVTLPEGYTSRLQIRDVLPEGLQADNFSFTFSSGVLHGTPQYVYNSTDNAWYIDFGQINATQSGTITIDYAVLVLNIPGNVNGINLVNNATLYYQNGTGTDINAGSDTATVKVIEPKLNITKTAGKTNLNPGENVTFTLNISHTAGSTADAYNLRIKDVIPAGLTYISGSSVLPAGWMVDESQAASNIIIFYTSGSTSLLLGQNVSINFTCTAGNFTWAGQNLTNNAGLNYTSSSNESLARTYGPINSSATVHVIGADVYVVKTGPVSVKAGQQLNYTLKIGNNGPDNAVNVTLHDLIDPTWFSWLTNVRYNINGVWYSFTNPLNLPVIASLQPGASNEIIINITGTVKSSAPAGILNNTASVNSTTADPVPDNNTSTVLTEIQQEADINVTKTGPNTVTAGNQISYNILVKNNGPSDAQHVLVTDKLPSYVIGLYYSLDNWVTWSSWPVAGTIDLGTIVANTSQQIWINGTVSPATPNGTVLNNTVNVTSPTDPEVHESWATSTVNTSSNLVLVKNNDPSSSIIAGNKLIYTIILVNNGPSVARNVVFVDDSLSSYLTGRMYRYSINGGTWNGWFSFSGPLTLTVTNSTNFPQGFMGVGDNFTVEIMGTVNSSTPDGTILTNYANVTSDTNPSGVISNTVINNVETQANLNIVKTAPVSVTAGQSTHVVFTLHISNTGPSDALNVVLNDIVDSTRLSGVEYQWDDSNWISWTGSLSLGTVAAGNEFDILIRGKVLSSALGELNNTANVTTSTSNTGNFSSNTTTIIKTLSGLNIVKTASPAVTAGQSAPLVYTLHVSNNGPSDALDVVLTDIIDSNRLSGIEYQWNGSQWTVWTGSLSLGTVTAGSAFDIFIRGHVLASALGQINNTANLTTTTENNGNLTSNTTTSVNTLSSLNIIKSAPSNVTAGQSDPVVFKLHITNDGPSDAQNVMLSDLVDSRLTNVEYMWNGSVWVPWNGSLSLGTVTAGNAFDIFIRAMVPDYIMGMIENTASLASDTATTGNLTSNTTTQIDTSANLTLNKTTDQETVTAGRNVVYGITLTNNGLSAARDLIFHDDAISSYLLNRSYRYSINGGTWTEWTGFTGPLTMNISSILPYGYLSTGEYITIQINGILNSSTPNGTVIFNYANVTSSTSPGEVISNTVNSTVVTEADLEITKVADVKKIVRGHPVHYIITITNNGPSDALNINLYDYYSPGELLNTYYATSTGIPWTAYTGPLDIKNLVAVLAPGNSITIWVNGTVSPEASSSLVNTAVTSSETDPSGNKTAQVTIPLQTSHVTIKKTVSNSRPYMHETIYFTLIVQNHGPDAAVSTYVEDKLPSGFKYLSATANYGSYDPVTGIWTIGDLPENAVAKLVIKCVVEKYGPLENHASVYTASYDPILDGHSSTAAVTVQKKPEPKPKPDHGKKVPMQKTGIPLQFLVLAVLMVAGGFVQRKRN